MSHCTICGGLIAEPNRAYGYAGKVCYCTKPRGWLKDKSGDVPLPVPSTVLAPQAPECTMTPAEFVSWIRGYFSAMRSELPTEEDWGRVTAALRSVK